MIKDAMLLKLKCGITGQDIYRLTTDPEIEGERIVSQTSVELIRGLLMLRDVVLHLIRKPTMPPNAVAVLRQALGIDSCDCGNIEIVAEIEGEFKESKIQNARIARVTYMRRGAEADIPLILSPGDEVKVRVVYRNAVICRQSLFQATSSSVFNGLEEILVGEVLDVPEPETPEKFDGPFG